MRRAIITRVDPSPAALAELKQWLAITTTQDDAGLTELLRASLEACEGFTGIMPVACTCEEVLAATPGWQTLATRPVQAITKLETLDVSGNRTALDATNYTVDLDADGGGLVSIASAAGATRVVVTFTAGLAADWDSLPETLRHGIMRLAAHQYRARDDGGAAPVPPAAVAALWRPWRWLRVA